MIDKETITTTFVGYAPYDDPAITFTVVSPDISNYDHKSNYQSNLNARLMRRISKLYFEKYQKSVWKYEKTCYNVSNCSKKEVYYG